MDTFICHSFICSKCSGGGTEGLLFTQFVEPPVNLNSVRLLNLDFVKKCWQLFADMNYGCACAGSLGFGSSGACCSGALIALVHGLHSKFLTSTSRIGVPLRLYGQMRM